MHPIRHRGRLAARPTTLASALVLATLAALPTGAQAAPRVLRAGHAAARADQLLVTKARTAARCRRSCDHRRGGVQRAGDRLASSTTRLTRAVQAASAATTARHRVAPELSADGRRLAWTSQTRLDVYVLARSVPGQAVEFSLVHGTRATPPAAPGATVTYSVRHAVASAPWAAPVTVSYPASRPARALRPVDAPQVTATPRAVSWTRVAAVRDYIVAKRIPGAPAVYEVVRGTSLRTSAPAGQRVTYAVRTAVVGSAWGTVDAGTPGAPTAAPPSSTTPAGPVSTPPAASGPFRIGVNSGSSAVYQLGAVRLVGARSARMEFDISTPVAEIAPAVLAYAQAGIQPLLLAGFNGRLPTQAEAQGLATWAATFGRGGTIWAGSGVPEAVQVAHIEFGNETNNPAQYAEGSRGDDWYYDPAFLARARTYATRVKQAGVAIQAANPAVGLLAVGDQYSGRTTWVDSMFQAVPDLGSYVAGWTVHPYGTQWQVGMDTVITATAAHGAPPRPLYATEAGWSSDDGRCLNDNYGWDPCMSYQAAAAALRSTVGAMRARYGTRLAQLYLYSTTDLSPSGVSDDREQYFGALRLDRSAKGAYTQEVKELLAANP